MMNSPRFADNICYTETDLLIIGGGSAGCMAAIQARELQPDLDITIFEKGDIKYSIARAWMP